MDSIVILMATYNGQQYIGEQLDSIINQTCVDWTLIIRDDGSSDGTVEIIQKYLRKDNRLRLINPRSEVQSACGNFSSLYKWYKQNCLSGYIMFCDQDDIWELDKIESSLTVMKKLEEKNLGKPCLLYGQMEFIDEEGNSIPGQIKMIEKTEFRHLISYNYIYGCTMMMNKLLLEKIDKIPVNAENHDYWIALVSTLGAIQFINKPLLKYRRHNNNVSGNVRDNNNIKQRILRHTIKSERLIRDLQKRLGMLTMFYNQYYNDIDEDTRLMLKSYLLSFRTSRISVMFSMLRYNIFRYSILQTISSFYLVIFFYDQIKPQSIIPAEL